MRRRDGSPYASAWRWLLGLLTAGWGLGAAGPAVSQPPPGGITVEAAADTGARAPAARLRWVATSTAVGYGALLTGLGASWYTGPRVQPRWFDDSGEWAQLDKAGHFWTAFHESRAAVDVLRWAGLSARRARIWGAPVGFLLQSPIEWFDARDPAYGASATDLAANAAGSLLLAGELALWDEVRLHPQVGLRLTSYAARRPAVLGRSVAERLLKDYNGQTYWLTADVGAFGGPARRWPRWLGVAVGYGATGLVYNDPARNRAAGFHVDRRFYLSPGILLGGLRPRAVWLRRVVYVLNAVRVPAPALEYGRHAGVRVRGLIF